LCFIIDGKNHQVSVAGSPAFSYGKNEVLSNATNDITFSQDWYERGYHVARFLENHEFENLVDGLTRSIGTIIRTSLGIELNQFDLSRYHQVVNTDEDHFKVVSRTRDLFSNDFNFPIMEVFRRFEQFLGFHLTDVNPKDGSKMHIIVRINRPFSTDFNPPHKDIYESVDNDGCVARFINFWIPICGVTQNSSLPIAPSSHLVPEDKILRTFEGGVVEGKTYRVRMIQSWAGSNRLTRAKVGYGEALIFSSHLIHGLAVNEEQDQTRVALEFRLFKQA